MKNNIGITVKHKVEQKQSREKLGGRCKVRDTQAIMLSHIRLYIYKIQEMLLVYRYFHMNTSRKTVPCFIYTALDKSKFSPVSVVRHWHLLPREARDSQFLEVFKVT